MYSIVVVRPNVHKTRTPRDTVFFFSLLLINRGARATNTWGLNGHAARRNIIIITGRN